MSLVLEFALETNNFLAGVRGILFGSADGIIATLKFFSPLTRDAPRNRHILGFHPAANRLPRKNIDLALFGMHSPGALGLRQIGFGGAEFVWRIAPRANVAREIDRLTRTEQCIWNVAKIGLRN